MKVNLDFAYGAVRRAKGMTLVELLTSMIVASVIMVALLQTLTAASFSWTQQSKNFSAQREGRVAMRILADDLAGMVMVPQWSRDIVAGLQSGQVANGPGEIAGTPINRLSQDPRSGFLMDNGRGKRGARIVFLRGTRQGDPGGEVGRGDLHLIMYGLALTNDGGASGLGNETMSRKLVRRELSAAETFRRVRDLMTAGLPLVTEDDWSALESLRDDPGVATTGVVGGDVIGFEIRGLDDLRGDAPVGGRQEWQPTQWIDVQLRVTNRQTGRLLQSEGDWDGRGALGRLINNGTENDFEDDLEVKTYSMRLRLPTYLL